MKRIVYSLIVLVLAAMACDLFTPPTPPSPREQASAPTEAAPAQSEEQHPAPSVPPPTESAPAEEGESPTMATCQVWLREQHSLNYPNHGCTDQADILNSVADNGGAVAPLGDNRFFIARFPENWDALTNRKMIVTLHGSCGCSEGLYKWWDRPTSEYGYALVALQYAEEDKTAEKGYAFDDAEQIYANLRTVFEQLSAHCPMDDTMVIYHGFSKGSARSFEIALLDQAETGMRRFAAFIADSGTGLADSGGEIPDYLLGASSDAYGGVNFWLYCGGQDAEGRTCEDMLKMGPWLEEHGATVTTYHYEPGGHAIFLSARSDGSPSEALTAMFEYIASINAPK